MSSVIFACALCFAAVPSAADIDRAAERAIEKFQVPGLALAIVCDDRVVHLKGYGVSSLNSKKPVTPDTVFPLASCSKPFTSALLASLAGDGKLDWDDRVQKHVPYFRLKDPLASERATLRDLVCHRTGLGPHPLLWYRSSRSLEERVRSLALLDPASDFRAQFHYQTIAFGAAGLAAESAGGAPWSDLLTTRILRPLGMAATTPVEPADSRSLAAPHRRSRIGVVAAIDRYPLSLPDPAGSVHSTARDLASFLRLQLNDGKLGDTVVVPASRLRQTHEPNVVIPMNDFARRINPETVQICYGLGWIVQDYRGQPMLLHGGAIDGFRSHLMLLPRQRAGIAIVSNLDSSLCNYALANQLSDMILETTGRDWIGEIAAREAQDIAADARRAAELRSRRLASARPPRPLGDYVGDFTDDAYGSCSIELRDKTLHFTWRGMRWPLEYLSDQVFLVNGSSLVDAPVIFDERNGRIVALRFAERTFAKTEKANSKK
jgi:CubicO group peptidase (beta-lactamase class C family)